MKNFLNSPNISANISPDMGDIALKNVLEDDAKLAQKAVNNAFIAFRDKHYAVEKYKMYVLAMVSSWLFQAISVAVAVVFVADLMLSLSDQIPIVSAYFLSVLILILLELGKRIFLEDVTSEYLKFRRTSPALVPLIVVISLSLVSSVGGAYGLAKTKTSGAILAQKQDETLATNETDTQIKEANKALASLKHTHSWAGKLTPAGLKESKIIQARIDKLTDLRAKEKDRVGKFNDGLDGKAETEGTFAGWGAAVFAFIIELIIAVGAWFCIKYNFVINSQTPKTNSNQTANVGFSQSKNIQAPAPVYNGTNDQEQTQTTYNGTGIGFQFCEKNNNLGNNDIEIVDLPDGKVKVIAHFKIGDKQTPFEISFQDRIGAQEWINCIHPRIKMEQTQSKIQPTTATPPPPTPSKPVIAPCANEISTNIDGEENEISEMQYEISSNGTIVLPNTKEVIRALRRGAGIINSINKNRLQKGRVKKDTFDKNELAVNKVREITNKANKQIELQFQT